MRLFDIGNVNQVTGIACFALAAGACALAARRGGRAWRTLAWMQAVFCLEIVVNARHRLHNVVDDMLRDHGWYAQRTPWQLGLLTVVAIVAVVCVPIAWRIARGDPLARVALAASLVVAASMTVEAVSLHVVDGFMYAGGAMLLPVVVGWIVASAVVIAAALGATRR